MVTGRTRPILEALEGRVLLASSLGYQAVADTPLTLRLVSNELEIVASTNPSTVLASDLPGNITDGVRIELENIFAGELSVSSMV